MLFSYNWLKDYIKGRLPEPKKLAELLSLHSFEVSEIKKLGRDWVLNIDVLPNRALDCFSHLGIVREISVITGLNYQEPFSLIKENKELKAKDFVSVEVKDKKACPRYTARVITEVRVGPSPKWLQERLEVCGLRPINNVVDILNFVMLETGQPLHGFDGEKLEDLGGSRLSRKRNRVYWASKKIIVRFAREREKIVTLDKEKYDLDKDILVIADGKKPIAIAGIKGGIIPEIEKSTKVVILESANFNPRVIRRSSKLIDLKTDASLRFEHGIDPNLTELAISRAAGLIQKIAGGKITQGLVDIYPQKVLPKRVKLNLNYVEKLLGVKFPEKEIIHILKRLNFKPISKQSYRPVYRTKREIEAEVPTWRLDISLPEDLIEEIGRIYGYENIPSSFPTAALIPPQQNLDIFWEDAVKNILKEVGFTEVYNYSFISENDAEIFRFSKNSEILEVENPISSEYKYIRPSLIPNLLKNTEKNLRTFREIRIFELGTIFYKKQKSPKQSLRDATGQAKNKKQVEEKRMISGFITGEAFYQAKGVLDLLLNKLGISNIWYDEYQPTPEESRIFIWHPQKCAEIKVGQEELGFLGEISPKITSDFRINNKVVIFDIDFEKLIKLASEEQEYRPISKYPAAVRDLAVLVPREARVEEVLNKIETAGGVFLRDIDLFDIYEGEEIPGGKKNLAFHLIYQAEDKTLSSREIDEIQQKIIRVLEKNPEWELRK